MSSVDVVLPVYNEEHVLERSVRALHRFLTDNLAHEWRIVIADNGSTDGTPAVGRRLAGELANVACEHIPEAGRGRALSGAWPAPSPIRGSTWRRGRAWARAARRRGRGGGRRYPEASCCSSTSSSGRACATRSAASRSEEHTSELQSRLHLVCRLLLEKKKK